MDMDSEPHTSLWRHRDFRRLWAAQSISAIGSRITRTALPVIAVLAVGGTAFELGMLAALSVAPGALVGLVSGGYIDRSRKRPLLIAADLARALLVLSVPMVAWFGELGMLQLYAVGAAVGACSALFQITDNTYLPALVGTRHLEEGNAKLEVTESVAEISGPGLAGLLIDWLSAPVAMLVDAVTYVASAVFLFDIKAVETPAARADEPVRWRDDARIGLRACTQHSAVRALFLANAAQTFFAGFLFALYMLFTLDTLGLSPGVVGAIISVGGVGALAGTFLARRLGSLMNVGSILLVTATLSQASFMLIPLASGSDVMVISALVAQQLIGDALFVAFIIHAVTLRQTALPLPVLGRANALFQTVSSALLPLGALVAGVIGEWLGVRTALWIGVSAGIATPLWLWPIRAFRYTKTSESERRSANPS